MGEHEPAPLGAAHAPQHHEAVAAEPREGRGGAADNSPGGGGDPLEAAAIATRGIGRRVGRGGGADFFEIAREKRRRRSRRRRGRREAREGAETPSGRDRGRDGETYDRFPVFGRGKEARRDEPNAFGFRRAGGVQDGGGGGEGARHGGSRGRRRRGPDGGGIGPTHAEEARARAAEEDPGAGAAEDDARRPAGDAAGRVCGEERRRGRGGVESRAPRGVRCRPRGRRSRGARGEGRSGGSTRERVCARRDEPAQRGGHHDKFYKHRPSTTADEAFPLDSFRAAAGDGLASARAERGPTAAGDLAAGAGVASLDAGSAANNKALWQWNQTLAMLSGQAGHPAGAFVDPSSPYASLFAAPASPAELKRVRDANGHALSEVATSLEAVRRCAAAVAAEGDSTDPSARAALVAKLERALREAEENKNQVPPSQRVEMAKTLVDLRAWIRAQLQARIRELAACAGKPAPELRGAGGEKAALSKEKGKAPAEARAEETPAFSPLAAVARANEDERGVSGGAISSYGDPSTE